MTDPKEILKSYGLKVTEQRVMILKEITGLKSTFTADTLYKKFSDQINQATIYRIIHTFFQKNIITEIPNTEDMKSYELTQNLNSIHPHLYCKECQNMYCLSDINDYDIKGLNKYRNNYIIDNIFIQFTGICPKCK